MGLAEDLVHGTAEDHHGLRLWGRMASRCVVADEAEARCECPQDEADSNLY